MVVKRDIQRVNDAGSVGRRVVGRGEQGEKKVEMKSNKRAE